MPDAPVSPMTGRAARSGASVLSADWLRRGQAYEAQGRAAEAVAAYDRAILAAPDDARACGLAWMNRGNALQKSGAPGTLPEAVRSYDAALGRFGALPAEADPSVRNHRGAAWLNRGHALIAADDPAGAVASFIRAIAELETLPLGENLSYRLNLAGAHTNLAHVLLAASPARARAAAHAALALMVGFERTRDDFAAMSLRARRTLVVALGELLFAGASDTGDFAAEASDAIDDGLALARECDRRGAADLRPLAARLFRLGAQLYRVHQPHFLGEFVCENLAPGAFADDAAFRAAAAEALGLALADLQRPQLMIAGSVAADRAVDTARSLRAARHFLSSLPT